MKKCCLRSRYQNQIGQVSVSLMSPPPSTNFPEADHSICSIFIRCYRTSTIDWKSGAWNKISGTSRYIRDLLQNLYHRCGLARLRYITDVYTPTWPSSICCTGSFLGVQCTKIRNLAQRRRLICLHPTMTAGRSAIGFQVPGFDYKYKYK